MQTMLDEWVRGMYHGRTFDDFLIAPGWGVAESRGSISLETKFSRNIKLNIPIVSANMDTVTGAKMAIAVARKGGIGIIHRYLTIEEQVQKVREVKRQESFVISEPHSISIIATIGEARKAMAKNDVGCLMITGQEKKLLGILTRRDVRFCSDDELVSARMVSGEALITAGPGTDHATAKDLLKSHRLEKLPLVDSNFKLVGLITSKDIENLERYPLANKDSNGQLIVGAAIGAVGDFLERAVELIDAGADVLVIDIANAQSVVGEKGFKAVRNRLPSAELVVGNIVIVEAVKKYQEWGADGLKVGLGPGSACTTRKNTNIGLAQLQATHACSRSASIPIIADGGIRRDGHLAMALIGASASSAMIGGGFAGTDETPGHVFQSEDGNSYKEFRGMASRKAMYDRFIAEMKDDPYEASQRLRAFPQLTPS